MDDSLKSQIVTLFGSTTYFYETVYLVIQNGHQLDNSNDPAKEQKMQTIEYYKSKIEQRLDAMGMEGKEWVADIASDYFEDYVHYRQPELSIPQAIFFENLKKVL